MKRIAILLLALLFVHGGVVWAMSDCLAVHDHHSALVSEQGADSHDSSEPVIHCPPINQQVGPAVKLSSVQIPSSERQFKLQSASFLGVVSPVVETTLWLEALFETTRSPSSSADPARHLFLSVFRI
jgi:hypothetical protein